ncbi:hypothetical protein [Chlamydiifrater phoenicopteri]|uniref:hypothetical protein n=1 Tax=Chlamydiifrater phoenicopteri TaxID=2681469 RepID=UPI001BCEE988|nr:hypothetical protein [Chlamydiifrater phoenicopteri]
MIVGGIPGKLGKVSVFERSAVKDSVREERISKVKLAALAIASAAAAVYTLAAAGLGSFGAFLSVSGGTIFSAFIGAALIVLGVALVSVSVVILVRHCQASKYKSEGAKPREERVLEASDYSERGISDKGTTITIRFLIRNESPDIIHVQG